jgi:nucleotide-binding universal stress UspA family protein
MTRAQVKSIETNLARVKQTWLGDRPNVRCETAIGDPAERILAEATREHVDLVVMASHGRGAIRRWVIGSVMDRVVRTSPIPVMVMRPRDGEHIDGSAHDIRRIVVPFDGSDLAAQALPFARRLALSLHLPILLVKVTEIKQSLDTALSYGVALGPEIYNEILRVAQVDDMEELALVASQLRRDGVEVQELVMDGVIADAIVSVLEPTDIIVMTSHGRGGLRRLVLGSIAEKLVRQGPVPVILVPATVREESPEFATEQEMKRTPVLTGISV